MKISPRIEKMPYLPVEMIDEIFQFIEDGEDLLNAIKGLFLTRTYHCFFLRDNYLWRRLTKLHYPFYVMRPSDPLLRTLIKLLRCFPNRLNEQQWDIANHMENLNADFKCPVTYVVGRGDGLCEACNEVDPRLVKKLHDIEHMSCLRHPELDIPKSEWIVNVLCNTEYGCATLEWHKALRAFIIKHFGSHIMRFLKNQPVWFAAGRLTLEEKTRFDMERSMVSLYLQESCSGGGYKPYDIYTKRRYWASAETSGLPRLLTVDDDDRVLVHPSDE